MILFDVIIIGSGPAGLFAAANIVNKKVLLLEKNNSLGKKLLISGSGRCNITHSGDIRDFFSHYGDNHRFLKHALNTFTNGHLIDFFEVRNLKTMEDKNGKIFPASDNAQDILQILNAECSKRGVDIRLNSAVTKIANEDNKFKVYINDIHYESRYLIIATGGKSYPNTGSNGDGFLFAQSLNHHLVLPKPALAPIYINNFKFASLSGISLINRKISLFRSGKKIQEHIGDIGFTHKGLSGPGILDFSRYFEINDVLKINLCDVNSDQLRSLLIESAEKSGKTSLKNFFKQFYIPENLIKHVLEINNIDPDCTLATITKEIRNVIILNFTELSFNIDRIGGFNIAMATSGGVDLSEIYSKTMQSKIIENLYFIGEVLDVDGDTGGYNIQAAFSTAYVAAKCINLEV